jgi:alpha-amylase
MWKCGSLSGTPTAINLPTLPAGLYWDTSDLMKTTGILRVTDVSTGIKGVSANSTEGGKYYTIDGRGVENPVEKGIYIRNGKKVIIK